MSSGAWFLTATPSLIFLHVENLDAVDVVSRTATGTARNAHSLVRTSAPGSWSDLRA